MPDILIVKCRIPLLCEQVRVILDYFKVQKETGVILLPPFYRMLDDISVDNTVMVKSFRDGYDEFCLLITANKNESIIVKTLFKEDDVND